MRKIDACIKDNWCKFYISALCKCILFNGAFVFMLFLVDILVYNYGFSACILMKILFVEWYLMKI